MEHHHHHPGSDPSKRLLGAILLNGLITIVEFIGGIASNSLALISDAVHNLSDTLALVLAWVAVRIGKRKANTRKTFGYQRFEILSAFLNASILTALSIYLIYEAILRFIHPETINSKVMMVVAIVGLAANLISTIFLHHHAKESLNVKAAYLHLLGDTLSSVGVIIGAVLLYFFNLIWIDPLLTLIISLVIMVQAYKVLRESTDILMQSTPHHIDLEMISQTIEAHPMVKNVHHVHCWQIQDTRVFFEAHLEISEDVTTSKANALICEIQKILHDQFDITHTTLQVEFGYCDDMEMIKH